MPDVEYESGAFHAYRATETINIGAIDTQTSGYNVKKDEVFRYDGDTIILKDGREFGGITQIRGAIKAGWFVNAADTDSIYRPKSANIQVRETEQRGQDKAPKHRVVVHEAEDAVAGTVAARKADRERKHEAISTGVPVMESPEAQAVVAAQPRPEPVASDEEIFEMLDAAGSEILDYLNEMVGLNFDAQVLFKSGDREMDLIAGVISEAGDEWIKAKIWEHTPDEAEESEESEDPTVAVRTKIETDMLGMFSMLDDLDEAPKPRKPRKAKARKAAPPASAKQQSKFPVREEERVSMPIKKADDDSQGGEVIATVPKRHVVEQEQTIAINVAPAKPEAEARPGFSGAIVVAEDQRDVGRVKLSETATRQSIDASAEVVQTPSDGVRMDKTAQVGPKKRRVVVSGESEGVAVGRVLSPTHTSFDAKQVASTSASQIDNIAKGKELKIEKYEVDAGEVRTAATSTAVATGDVQEVQTGEELTDILPDAATPPAPEPKVYIHQDEDPAFAAVKMLIPNFEWNKERRWQDRVEDAMKFAKKPQYMKGILAVETEIVRDKIKVRLVEFLQGESKPN